MTKLKKLLSMLLALAMLLSLVACGGTDAPAEEPAEEPADEPAVEDTAEEPAEEASAEPVDTSVLKVALTNSFTGLSAINTANPYRYATLSQVYQTLACSKDGEFYGVLAESWEKVDEGVYNITLKEGITDSDGNSFTAADVEFSLNALKNVGFDESKYYDEGAVEVKDDLNLTLTLNTDSEGAFNCILVKMFMCTQEAYEASPDQMATRAVGTGPYVISDYVEGSYCNLAKRTDYWNAGELAPAEVANYDAIEISYLPEATQMDIAINSGDVQFAGQVDMSISDSVDAAEGMTSTYISNGTYNGLSFNMKGRVVSDNVALRQAVCYAIDPNGLIAGAYNGHAQLMNFYGMNTASDWNSEWTSPYSYDPEMAAQKLAESGVSNPTLVLLANNKAEDMQIAELIQAYLGAIGITVEFDYVDPATQDARRAEGNWDLCLAGGMGVADMYLFWSNLYNRESTGMSKYFHNDEALYATYDVFAAVGGKTTGNLQAIYEWEAANASWLPMFNKQVLYSVDNNYEGMLFNDLYMSLPYLGTLQPKA